MRVNLGLNEDVVGVVKVTVRVGESKWGLG